MADASCKLSAARSEYVSSKTPAWVRNLSLGRISRQPRLKTESRLSAACRAVSSNPPERCSRAIALCISTVVAHQTTGTNCFASVLTLLLVRSSTQSGIKALESQKAVFRFTGLRPSHPGLLASRHFHERAPSASSRAARGLTVFQAGAWLPPPQEQVPLHSHPRRRMGPTWRQVDFDP
jgi:hypothetical protein